MTSEEEGTVKSHQNNRGNVRMDTNTNRSGHSSLPLSSLSVIVVQPTDVIPRQRTNRTGGRQGVHTQLGYTYLSPSLTTRQNIPRLNNMNRVNDDFRPCSD